MKNIENRTFHIALFASLLIHTGVLVHWAYLNKVFPEKLIKQMEITYQKMPKDFNEAKMELQKYKEEPAEKRRNDDEFFRDVGDIPVPLLKDDVDVKRPQIKVNEKISLKLDHTTDQRKISVPYIEPEKMNNPNYLNYYQIVRERIKNNAYQLYSRFDVGEIYMAFILNSNGKLKKIKIVDGKTTANSYLRSIGLRSIQESAPFPKFPEELHYPELPFNVLISFEVRD